MTRLDFGPRIPVRRANDCPRCGGEMRRGIATEPTLVTGSPDFHGDAHGTTMWYGGPGKIVPCLKCKDCGWSVSE